MIAAIYVRTSTLRQGEEGTSLETQEEQSRLKAIELGVDPAYIWREMESGAYTDRPGLNLETFVVDKIRERILTEETIVALVTRGAGCRCRVFAGANQ